MSPRGSTPPRIAIIGAGPAGLLAARLLKRRGYPAVTLYERAQTVAGTSRSHTVDGHTFDLSTKFVPTFTLAGAPIDPAQESLFVEYGAELVPSVDPVLFDAAQGRVPRASPLLRKYGRAKLLHDVALGYRMLRALDGADGVAAVYRRGLARPDETILEWGARHDIAAFAELACYLSDIFSGGPSHRRPVGYLLMSRYFFVAGYLKRILDDQALARVLVATACSAAGWCSGDASWHELARFAARRGPPAVNAVLRHGYPFFFATLARREALSIRLAADVRRVAYRRQGEQTVIDVVTADGAETYDAIVFATPPAATAAIARDQPAIHRLFADIAPDHIVRTWLFTAGGWPENAVGRRGVLLDASNASGLGTSAMVRDGTVYGVSKEYAASDVLATPVYLPPEMAPSAAEAQFASSLGRLGLRLKKIIAYEDFSYPRIAPTERIAAGWFDAVDRLQGQNATYFIGEVLAGQGIPGIIRHVEQFIPRHFPARMAAG
jgi:glycine/D-amino acid oxidase-like deaminating enzyme